MPTLPQGEGLWPIQNAGETEAPKAERTRQKVRLEKWAGDRYTVSPVHSALHISKLTHGQELNRFSRLTNQGPENTCIRESEGTSRSSLPSALIYFGGTNFLSSPLCARSWVWTEVQRRCTAR